MSNILYKLSFQSSAFKHRNQTPTTLKKKIFLYSGAGSVSSTANATTAPTSISSTSASTTNFTTLASTRPYEATSIPGWGFIGPCDWISANKVDLTLSSIGILYNFIITLLPLFASRMYSIQGAVISSYSLGAFLVSVYSAFFHSRLLSVQDVDNEVRLFYLLTWFMNYLFLFHIHLLSWDQHHSLTHFKAHRRLVSKCEARLENGKRCNDIRS